MVINSRNGSLMKSPNANLEVTEYPEIRLNVKENLKQNSTLKSKAINNGQGIHNQSFNPDVSYSDGVEPRSWDKFRYKYHGKFTVKIKNMKLKMLTGISPYDPDCLEISTNLLYVDHFETELKVLI